MKLFDKQRRMVKSKALDELGKQSDDKGLIVKNYNSCFGKQM